MPKNDFKCLINKTSKKITYPHPVILELLNFNNIGPISIVINEIRSGENLLIEFDKKTPKRIFTFVGNSVNQIYGPIINYNNVIEIDSIEYSKKKQIDKYIKNLLNNFSVNELITYKNDFEELESELMKYLLLTKNIDRLEIKQIRSIAFKTCKNPKLAEKISSLIKKNLFNKFENTPTIFTVDFCSLTVQNDYDSTIYNR